MFLITEGGPPGDSMRPQWLPPLPLRGKGQANPCVNASGAQASGRVVEPLPWCLLLVLVWGVGSWCQRANAASCRKSPGVSSRAFVAQAVTAAAGCGASLVVARLVRLPGWWSHPGVAGAWLMLYAACTPHFRRDAVAQAPGCGRCHCRSTPCKPPAFVSIAPAPFPRPWDCP